MKTLSLYVDKWFIAVAVDVDGNALPLSLPNGEDRIWLFFHEDTANNCIVYGKGNEASYRDGKPHYIGDVFTLIEQSDATFVRYDQRPEVIQNIFQVAGIFNDLHNAAEEEGKVDTYVSFSTDVPQVARLKFLDELKDAKFTVRESVARISHLALEECSRQEARQNVFSKPGHYLVLVATNDNLHYAIYEKPASSDLYLRTREDTLPGFGLDMRRRALVEYVVENINRATHFLSTPEEYAREYMRMERFAYDWLRVIAEHNPHIPVSLPDITLANAPNNTYAVTINRSQLDDRTAGIVDNITRTITVFIKDCGLTLNDINGIVFIGNTFTNDSFREAMKRYFAIDERAIAIYRDRDLPRIVNTYNHIDCKQFSSATASFIEDAKTEETRIRQLKEDEDKQRKAEEADKQRREETERKREVEKNYNEAVENIERYERGRDYVQMKEWADIALTHRPGDEYAQEKKDIAISKAAQQKADNDRYQSCMTRAKRAAQEERWSDVISQCDSALEIDPESADAKRLRDDACLQLDKKEKIKDFLTRADLFKAQKSYTEALAELDKVLNLDPKNEEATSRREEISDILAKQQADIDELTTRLNTYEQSGDYNAAMDVCEKLSDLDLANQRKWAAHKERLKGKADEIMQRKAQLGSLRKSIDEALFIDEWERLKLLCETYLEIEDDSSIEDYRNKACRKLEMKQREIEAQQREAAKIQAETLIKKLIADEKLNEAERELKSFEEAYPDETALVKDLRRLLFAAECNFSTPATQQQGDTRKPIGFDTSDNNSSNTAGSGDNFVNEEPKRKSGSSPGHTKKTAQQPHKEHDFFDEAKAGKTQSDSKGKYTNDDFNF